MIDSMSGIKPAWVRQLLAKILLAEILRAEILMGCTRVCPRVNFSCTVGAIARVAQGTGGENDDR